MQNKKIVLDEWQKEAIEHKGNLLLCTGRQIGKTFTLAKKCAQRMVNEPGTHIIIASLTEDQAKLIIVMILDELQRTVKSKIAKGKKKPTQNKVTLTNGSFALARPVGNTGDAIRGFTGHILVLDEVSRFNELIMTASMPTLLSTGGEIWAASTPFGKKGWFWEEFDKSWNRKDPTSNFKVIYQSSEFVVYNRQLSESWTEQRRAAVIAFLENQKRTMSRLQYGQEYQGLFMEDLNQFFLDEWIDKVCKLQRNTIKTGVNYLGVDIARFGDDETTYEVVCNLTGKIYHKENIVKTKQDTVKTEKEIIQLSIIWKCAKVGIDAGAGSLGVGIYDHLLQSPLRRKVVAMNNRALSLTRDDRNMQRLQKEDYYDFMRALGERGDLMLLDEENVRLSLKSVQIEDKGDRIEISGNYTHITEGLVRAVWLAIKEKPLNISIHYV